MIAFSQFLDNEDNLNKEERAFVEMNPEIRMLVRRKNVKLRVMR